MANKPAKLNKKLLARTSGTTKGEVRGVAHMTGTARREGLLAMAKGGPRAGVKRGSPAAKRAIKEVKSYLKATSPKGGAKRAKSKRI